MSKGQSLQDPFLNALRRERADHARARRARQFAELRECRGVVLAHPLRLHQQRAFAFA